MKAIIIVIGGHGVLASSIAKLAAELDKSEAEIISALEKTLMHEKALEERNTVEKLRQEAETFHIENRPKMPELYFPEKKNKGHQRPYKFHP